jgi:hypothetical protein
MLKDILGNEVHEGDTIAIAMRRGDSAVIGMYEIVSIELPKDPDDYSTPRYPVKAKQLEIGSYYKNTRPISILHGETFSRKVIVIKPS